MAPSDRVLCGWQLGSDIALPELPPGTASSQDVEIEFRLGRAEVLTNAQAVTPLIEIGEHGAACRISIPGAAKFLVEAGASVTVEPDPAAARCELRTFLLGPVLAVLALQRGLLPFHAACVEIDGMATLLVGGSGSGKSVLAAALGRRGYRVLADEVTVIDIEAGPAVLPLCPSVTLWHDALDAFGIDARGLAPNRTGQERYWTEFSSPSDFDPTPVPVGRIELLVPADGDGGICPLEDGPSALAAHAHFARFAPLLSPGLSLADMLARLSDRIDRLDLPWGLERVGAAADMIISGSSS